jgi:hypothetical protein
VSPLPQRTREKDNRQQRHGVGEMRRILPGSPKVRIKERSATILRRQHSFGRFCASTATYPQEPVGFSHLLYALSLSARHPPAQVNDMDNDGRVFNGSAHLQSRALMSHSASVACTLCLSLRTTRYRSCLLVYLRSATICIVRATERTMISFSAALTCRLPDAAA